MGDAWTAPSPRTFFSVRVRRLRRWTVRWLLRDSPGRSCESYVTEETHIDQTGRLENSMKLLYNCIGFSGVHVF